MNFDMDVSPVFPERLSRRRRPTIPGLACACRAALPTSGPIYFRWRHSHVPGHGRTRNDPRGRQGRNRGGHEGGAGTARKKRLRAASRSGAPRWNAGRKERGAAPTPTLERPGTTPEATPGSGGGVGKTEKHEPPREGGRVQDPKNRNTP